MRKLIIMMIVAFVAAGNLSAQNSQLWDEFVDEWFDSNAEAEQMDEQCYETLCEIHRSPIAINLATRGQLEQLPFLTDRQIEDIIAYIYQNGPMKSLRELQLVASLDSKALRYLPLFITLEGEPVRKPLSLVEMIKRGKGESMTRVDATLNTKAGYRDIDAATLQRYPNRVYKGNRLGITQRLVWNYGNKFQSWLIGQKDPGEPFASNGVRWFDYVSAGVVVNDIGRLKTLAVGDYRINIGAGLIMGSSFISAKTATASTGIKRGGTIVRRHSSTMESGFLRGVACSYEVAHGLVATAFLSRRNIDANLKGDSMLITSLKTDGLHRTELELSKRGNTRNTLIGGNLTMRNKTYQLGITGVVDNYQHLFITRGEDYRKYHPEGNNFCNFGIDYSLWLGRLSVGGETAMATSGGLATINSVEWRMNGNWTMNAVQRYYSFRYNALHSNALSEGGAVKNESGLMVKADGRLGRRTDVQAMVDFFHFPWMRRGVSSSSSGVEMMAAAAWRVNNDTRISMKWRGKWKQKDGDDKQLIDYNTQRLQLRADYKLCHGLTMKTQLNATAVSYQQAKTRWGAMVMQNAELTKGGWQVALQAAVFSTADYECRITAYEPGMMYAFSFPSFYYKGWRGCLRVRSALNSHLTLVGKIAATHYFDRSTIGSGTELIDSSTRSDASVQIIWRF